MRLPHPAPFEAAQVPLPADPSKQECNSTWLGYVSTRMLPVAAPFGWGTPVAHCLCLAYTLVGLLSASSTCTSSLRPAVFNLGIPSALHLHSFSRDGEVVRQLLPVLRAGGRAGGFAPEGAGEGSIVSASALDKPWADRVAVCGGRRHFACRQKGSSRPLLLPVPPFHGAAHAFRAVSQPSEAESKEPEGGAGGGAGAPPGQVGGGASSRGAGGAEPRAGCPAGGRSQGRVTRKRGGPGGARGKPAQLLLSGRAGMEFSSARGRRRAARAGGRGRYPHSLQFYLAPPAESVSLAEFESFAVDRLRREWPGAAAGQQRTSGREGLWCFAQHRQGLACRLGPLSALVVGAAGSRPGLGPRRSGVEQP